MIKLFRKLKAKITRNYPCSFDTNHGHDLEMPACAAGYGWASFKCRKCSKRLTYVKALGGFID